MKETFKYELKRCIPFFPVILAIGIIILFFDTLIISFSVYNITSYIGSYVFLSLILLIFYNFGYNKKKISLDLYYALPVSHKELFIGKYLFTLVEILIEFIALLLFSYIFVGINCINDNIVISSQNLLAVFLVVLVEFVSAIGLFNLYLLFFNLANSKFEAGLYLIIVSFIPHILFICIFNIIDKLGYSLGFNLCSMLNKWCYYYLYGLSTYGVSQEMYVLNTTIGIVITAICYLSFILLYFYTVNSYAEMVELPDKKKYGYKLLVPLLFILLFFYCGLVIQDKEIATYVILVALLIAQYILYIIFERTLKLSKYALLSLGIVSVIGLVMLIVL